MTPAPSPATLHPLCPADAALGHALARVCALARVVAGALARVVADAGTFSRARAWARVQVQVQVQGRAVAAASLVLSLVLAGCTTVPPMPTTSGGTPIDTSRSAQGQDSRVLFLVLHYTVADFPISMKILTERDVSAHYLVSDEAQPRIFRLVDESRRAWHSGVSAWKGHRLLNASSIGIEIVHPGYKPGPDKQRIYQPFSQAQMDVLLPLVRDIVQRHQIRPDRVLGHGEVAPSYKEDPGPTFPWHLLAAQGLTPPLPDAARVAEQRLPFELKLPEPLWFQERLAQHGYAIERTGLWDAQSQRVLMNFQMRYRPAQFSGQPDAESAALLQVLTAPVLSPGVPAGASTGAAARVSAPASVPAPVPAARAGRP